jgi:lysophospholipase L1-like esterase
MRWLRRISVMASGALLAGGLGQVPTLAATAPAQSAAAPVHTAASTGQLASPGGTQAAPGTARLSDPARVLPSGWQRSSDEAVTVAGDSTGLHVLAASEASGYGWRTVATLGDPAVETDSWIGQACVTASGGYAVVVYAPEQAANMAGAQGVLGRAAIVNLRTGAVKDLGGGYSIAYFDPGCGTGDQAALTRGGWANDASNAAMSTTLVLADAATGRVSAPVKVAGQLTSAVPYGGQIAAAGSKGLEQVSASGKTRLLAAAAAVPFRLTPAADGSLGYQTMAGKRVDLWQLAGGHPRRVASAQAGSVELRQIGGRVWLVGPQASKVAGLPRQWQPVDAPAIAQPSTTGTLAVTDAGAAAPAKGQRYDPASPQAVAISTQLLTGKRGTASFKVATTAAPPPAAKAATTAVAGLAASRTVLAAATAQTAGSPSTPVSDDRTCAIPLDDPSIQAYQPNFQQVEWAVDQAVQGTLTDQRPAGLYGSSLPSYTPQGLFSLPSVAGGGSLPAQVLLGVLTAESNLQQASVHVIQGQTANPLTSFNWYGNWINGETTDTGMINWEGSDCGYGIGQITSGMCVAQGQNNDSECAYQPPGEMSPEQQLAVAVDYQANIAKAAQLLIGEWNTLTQNAIIPTGPGVPSGDPYSKYVGEWYMAIWAYNSGLEPGSPKLGNTTGCSPGPTCTDNGGSGGNWGLGYADNPINPIYPPDRPVFNGTSSAPTPTGTTYSANWDASHPQYWPYQEKVIAWAFDSITLWDYSQGKDIQAYAWAHGTTMVPPYDHFCTVALNSCDPSNVDFTKATAPDSCTLSNDHCWWHYPNGWQATTPTLTCSNCGQGVITYAAGAAAPGPEPIAPQFAQTCASSLPSNAVIVGNGGQSALGCPGQNWTSKGSFTWNFAADSNGNYSSKIYFDQIGAGFGGHFWFGYAQPSATPSSTVITGTWNPPSSVSGWTDIRVALPSYGANADGASYQVSPGGSASGRDVLVNQGATTGTNTWVDLGAFDLGSGANVSLSNVTPNTITINGSGTGSDLAWSAAAFIPVSGPSWTYTAMGDSYSSGEGNPPYDVGTAGGCDRSQEAFGRQFAAADSSIGNAGIQHIACSGATTKNLTTTGQNGEQPQISQMYSGTKLVTATIGGNDIGFASVLTSCLTNPTTGCLTKYNNDDDNNLYAAIDNLTPDLIAAYQAMQKQAPDAEIVAVTYPEIFQPGTTCTGILNLPVPDVDFLNDVGLYLDNTITDAAHAAGINVMDERYAFLGHQLCSADPWIYQLPTGFTAGTSVFDSSAWFHPNAEGQGHIATDLAAYWKALQAAPPEATKSAASKTGNAASKTANAAAAGWEPLNLPDGIPDTAQATVMLEDLPRTSTELSGYNSGAAYWNFTTVNGCDTRQDVLRAQAVSRAQWSGVTPVAPPAGSIPLCPLTAGAWQTPYDAAETPINFATQTDISNTIAIDHIVPKAEAWALGAQTWVSIYGATLGNALLSAFSNSRGTPELLAVSSTSNSAKGDNSPEEWMPTANPGMTCPYIKMWIAVKYEFQLNVSTIIDAPSNPIGTSELTFLQNSLSSC